MTHERVIVLTLAFALIACTSPSPTVEPTLAPDIRIALFFPTEHLLAGKEGKAAHRGALLAIEQCNSTGGLLGVQVESLLFDSGCDAAKARQAVDAAKDQGIVLFIGGLCASEAIPISEAIDGTGIFLSLNAHRGVSGGDDGGSRAGVFVTVASGGQQVRAIVRFARDHLQAQTASTLYDSRSSLSSNLADEFARSFDQAEGQFVEENSYYGAVNDWTVQLESIAAHPVDVLFLPNCAPEVNAIALQAGRIGIRSTQLGCDSWALGQDLRAVNDGYYCTEFTPHDPGDQTVQFLAAYRERFAEEADSFAAWGYEATRILLAAIRTAGSTDIQAVEHALRDSEFESVGGTVRFDASGLAHKSLAIVHVEDGAQRLVARIAP